VINSWGDPSKEVGNQGAFKKVENLGRDPGKSGVIPFEKVR